MNIKRKGLLVFLAAACILTGCGKTEESSHYGVLEDEAESSELETTAAAEAPSETTTTTETQTTADETETTTDETGTATGAAARTTAARTTAAAGGNAAVTTAANAADPVAPAEQEAVNSPVLMARAITDGTFQSINGTGDLSYRAGDEFAVLAYDFNQSLYENTVELMVKDQDSATMQLSDFILLPTAEYVDSLNDDQLKSFAAALFLQYSNLYQLYTWGMEPLGLESNGDSDVTMMDNFMYVEMEPACTWEELLQKVNKYFTKDCAFTGSGETEDFSSFLREKDGHIWRRMGFGGVEVKTYVETQSIRSRTKDEIVFDMTVKEGLDFNGERYNQSTETFILRCEDGLWKCAAIPATMSMS